MAKSTAMEFKLCYQILEHLEGQSSEGNDQRHAALPMGELHLWKRCPGSGRISDHFDWSPIRNQPIHQP